ncbi:hypothetical protein Leryth_002062 [Lithospermum erythrorhizon]|nr:hypothetical protein Leryth_002062 [Lithospermum erythrorhizon]
MNTEVSQHQISTLLWVKMKICLSSQNRKRRRRTVSCREYYVYKLQVRDVVIMFQTNHQTPSSSAKKKLFFPESDDSEESSKSMA